MSTQYIINNSDDLLTGQTINGDITVNGNLIVTGTTNILPYKVYTALLTQTGTTDPVSTILENTLGDIVWTRGGVGYYIATLASSFTTNKTAVITGNPLSTIPPVDVLINLSSVNSVDVNTITSGSPNDDILFKTFIEIRVYN